MASPVRNMYLEALHRGLSQLADPRELLATFTRSVLASAGEELSSALPDDVVFQWRGKLLHVYCPRTGRGCDVGRMELLGGGESGIPRVALQVSVGGGERGWVATCPRDVEQMVAGMLEFPELARVVAEVVGSPAAPPQARG